MPAGDDSSPLLMFDFKYPVTEAVFSLGNGEPGVTAELKAYDSAGRLLGGTFQSPEIDAVLGVFFGIKATSDPPISKVTISYSSSQLQEQVIDFSFAYQTRGPTLRGKTSERLSSPRSALMHSWAAVPCETIIVLLVPWVLNQSDRFDCRGTGLTPVFAGRK